ncbi:uncharacterized protein LOC113215513 [Frankliniella occidentalis]|uniref:Uncharacterized protein LOC113215513 n=1 Tax=Frankliniella occidentalis TaxID=133901 RepID=A0A9C6WYW8_FRAOC|nr:uncharacterized protein LOC113215513 [Frankliniella occidentalis]
MEEEAKRSVRAKVEEMWQAIKTNVLKPQKRKIQDLEREVQGLRPLKMKADELEQELKNLINGNEANYTKYSEEIEKLQCKVLELEKRTLTEVLDSDDDVDEEEDDNVEGSSDLLQNAQETYSDLEVDLWGKKSGGSLEESGEHKDSLKSKKAKATNVTQKNANSTSKKKTTNRGRPLGSTNKTTPKEKLAEENKALQKKIKELESKVKPKNAKK